MEEAGLAATPRLIPREVVALRRGEGGPIAGGYGGALGRISESKGFRTAEGDLTLELHVTLPGEEAMLLSTLARRKDVVAAGQNLVGAGQDVAPEPPPAPPVRRWLVGGSGPDGAIGALDEPRLEAELRPDRHGTPTVVVVDVEPGHCVRVMESVLAGYRSRKSIATSPARPAPECTVIGLTLETADSTFATLHRYSELLLTVGEIHRDVLSVNLSVDFGCAVLGGGVTGGVGHQSPLLQIVSYSLPFFEAALRIATRTLEAESARLRATTYRRAFGSGGRVSSAELPRGVRPAVFAPAGNSASARRRCRMAYPALRPEVVAATVVSARSGGDWAVAPCADLPAVYDIKPCVGVDERDLPHTSGTSHACAFLAGAFAGHVARLPEWPDRDESSNDFNPPSVAFAGSLAKTASVLTLAETARPAGVPSAPPTAVAVLGRDVRAPRSTFLDGILRELDDIDGDAEFAITGSTAAVALAVPGGSSATLRSIFSALGDLDLLHSGRTSEEIQSKAIAVARRWVEREVGRGSKRGGPLSVELHPLQERVSANALLQCVVPASAVFLTTEGVVDALGGSREIEDGVLTTSILRDRMAWRFNPSFQLGSNGVATGLLIWASHVLLLTLARRAFGFPAGVQADRACLETARTLVRESDDELLLGMAPDLDDGVFRRLDRARGLLARLSQDRVPAGPIGKLVDEISGRLERAHPPRQRRDMPPSQ